QPGEMGSPCKIGGATLAGDSLACVLREHIPNPETRTGSHAGDPNIQRTCRVFDGAVPNLGQVELNSETMLKCNAPSDVTVYYGIYHDRREVATDYQDVCAFVRHKATCQQSDYGLANAEAQCTSTSAPQENQWYVDRP